VEQGAAAAKAELIISHYTEPRNTSVIITKEYLREEEEKKKKR
jgi:hypothetical protein